MELRNEMSAVGLVIEFNAGVVAPCELDSSVVQSEIEGSCEIKVESVTEDCSIKDVADRGACWLVNLVSCSPVFRPDSEVCWSDASSLVVEGASEDMVVRVCVTVSRVVMVIVKSCVVSMGVGKS